MLPAKYPTILSFKVATTTKASSIKLLKYFSPSLDNCDEIVASILEQKYDIITINDNPSLSNNDFTTIKPRINEALNSLLPNKSRFEI